MGAEVFEPTTLPLITVQHLSPEGFAVRSGVFGLGAIARAEFVLEGGLGDLFVADSLPANPPDLSVFGSSWFQLTVYDATHSAHLLISGTLDSSHRVPEPCSMLMMIGGSWLVVIVTARRRM